MSQPADPIRLLEQKRDEAKAKSVKISEQMDLLNIEMEKAADVMRRLNDERKKHDIEADSFNRVLTELNMASIRRRW
jgi:hypothetical protein